MGKLIHDITPAPVSNVPAFLRGYGKKSKANRIPTTVMVKELYDRGVSIEYIFGVYYELAAIEDAMSDEIFGNDEEGLHGKQVLTVGDAELAGLAQLPAKPESRQPF